MKDSRRSKKYYYLLERYEILKLYYQLNDLNSSTKELQNESKNLSTVRASSESAIEQYNHFKYYLLPNTNIVLDVAFESKLVKNR